jgi:predicted outer membrane protein
MKVKFVLMAASVAASLAGMPAANAAEALWGADQQATTAEMDNQLNVDAAKHGFGEQRTYQTHRHDGTWR